MRTIPALIKTTALAAVIAAGASFALTGSASAATYRTECGTYTDGCVQLRCTDFGNYCTIISYNAYDRYFRYRQARYACDRDGDNCRWTRDYYIDEDGDPILNPY
jgi:hypothetical protein